MFHILTLLFLPQIAVAWYVLVSDIRSWILQIYLIQLNFN